MNVASLPVVFRVGASVAGGSPTTNHTTLPPSTRSTPKRSAMVSTSVMPRPVVASAPCRRAVGATRAPSRTSTRAPPRPTAKRTPTGVPACSTAFVTTSLIRRQAVSITASPAPASTRARRSDRRAAPALAGSGSSASSTVPTNRPPQPNRTASATHMPDLAGHTPIHHSLASRIVARELRTKGRRRVLPACSAQRLLGHVVGGRPQGAWSSQRCRTSSPLAGSRWALAVPDGIFPGSSRAISTMVDGMRFSVG